MGLRWNATSGRVGWRTKPRRRPKVAVHLFRFTLRVNLGSTAHFRLRGDDAVEPRMGTESPSEQAPEKVGRTVPVSRGSARTPRPTHGHVEFSDKFKGHE